MSKLYCDSRLVFLIIFQIRVQFTTGGPCKVKPIQHSYDENDEMLNALFVSSAEDDYYTEQDIIPNSIKLNHTFSEYSVVEEGVYTEEDIIPSSSNTHYVDLGMKWPNATVPFVFHNMMNLEGRMQVLRAMNEYHRHTCIQFKKRQAEKDYLVIGSSYQFICASNVGRQGGAQMLHLAPACTRTLGTPMHELMHALGFVHEHMRPDRDRYIYINYSNIHQGLWKNFHEVQPSLAVNELGAGYDFGSLMHYRLCAMTNNSWPTIVPKVNPQTDLIGQRKGFSVKDIIKLNNYYSCSDITRSPKLFAVDLVETKRPKNCSYFLRLNSKLIIFMLYVIYYFYK